MRLLYMVAFNYELVFSHSDMIVTVFTLLSHALILSLPSLFSRHYTEATSLSLDIKLAPVLYLRHGLDVSFVVRKRRL